MRPISEIDKRPVKKMSDYQLQLEGERIINHLYYSCKGGTVFGCDWRTMWVLYPELCNRFDALKTEYRSRFPVAKKKEYPKYPGRRPFD